MVSHVLLYFFHSIRRGINKPGFIFENNLIWVNDSFDILFLSQRRKGQAIQKSGVEGWLHKLGEAAHIDNVHPHRFRRTLATNLMKKGMRVEEVQMLLGHDNISTTMMYCQVQQEAVKHNHRRYSVS